MTANICSGLRAAISVSNPVALFNAALPGAGEEDGQSHLQGSKFNGIAPV
jgi:hypothetical protein